MDIAFKCPHCDQELEVDASGAGSSIECPACNRSITVPSPEPQPESVNGAAAAEEVAPVEASAAAKAEKHYSVPTHHSATEALIQKANRPLEIAAKDSDKKVRVKTFKHTDCHEVGKDRFDEVVSTFLEKVGWDNVISVTPVTYSYLQLDTRANISDYGILIVYRG
jgi:DNA-directed RNA polymerase subunit RPC12/RpoP